MRQTRLKFKYALRQCKNNEESARADSLAKDLLFKDYETFLENIFPNCNKKVSLSESIAEVLGEQKISQLWHDHFKCLLNSVHRSRHEEVAGRIAHCVYTSQKWK